MDVYTHTYDAEREGRKNNNIKNTHIHSFMVGENRNTIGDGIDNCCFATNISITYYLYLNLFKNCNGFSYKYDFSLLMRRKASFMTFSPSFLSHLYTKYVCRQRRKRGINENVSFVVVA